MKHLIITLVLCISHALAHAAMPLKSESQKIEARPGETVQATLAIGQVNRIVLPFDAPEIRTLNPSTAELQGRVLYVAPIDHETMHLYVSEARDPETSLALSFTPEETHPREVIISLAEPIQARPPESLPQAMSSSDEEQGSQLKDSLRQTLKTLAMGQIPEGYRLRNPQGRESIRCRQKFALIQTRQVVESGNSKILVGVLHNSGKAPLELNEEACLGNYSIEAIGLFPAIPLRSGQESEIYMVLAPEHKETSRTRPNLINKRP
jgi:conjugal transfer pilus assembly protein TraK